MPSTIEMTDRGLICGGVLLARMTTTGGRACLAVDDDADRMLALLSVGVGRPVARACVLPHIQSASDYWQSGDKALANLRLVFAGLPNPTDGNAVECLRLAGDLLDDGLAPSALMKACWPAAVVKYAPDQPRVPAGNGRRSGEWDFRTGSSTTTQTSRLDERIVVATVAKPPANDGGYLIHEFEGQTTLEEDVAHGQPINPFGNTPLVAGAGEDTANEVSAAAKAAVEAIGLGRGPVYGTRVHTEFKTGVEAFGRSDLHTEETYFNGQLAKRGTPGSIRVDVGEGPKEQPHTVYDLKTGGAKLTESRIQQLRFHLPNGKNVKIFEVHP